MEMLERRLRPYEIDRTFLSTTMRPREFVVVVVVAFEERTCLAIEGA